MKICSVVFATPLRQYTWSVPLADTATVQDALTHARGQAGAVAVPWDGDVGIFGELCARDTVPLDGDRIEVYRPLKSDPKESRRERAKARKQARDQEFSRPRQASHRKA